MTQPPPTKVVVKEKKPEIKLAIANSKCVPSPMIADAIDCCNSGADISIYRENGVWKLAAIPHQDVKGKWAKP